MKNQNHQTNESGKDQTDDTTTDYGTTGHEKTRDGEAGSGEQEQGAASREGG